MKLILSLCALALVVVAAAPASAFSYMIGDNDGYGAGVPDNGQHPFDGINANYDGRSAAEMAATDGAQFTDTYSTTQPGFSPQAGTVATFLFTGLGSGWTVGHLEIDMADFQASTFGAVAVDFNGIAQNWAYNDGFPNTYIRYWSLDNAVLTSINNTGALTINVDRNASSDFYGFDYLKLNDFQSPVPEPATYALLLGGLGVLGFAAYRRKVKAGSAA
jgi:hypothetical protein